MINLKGLNIYSIPCMQKILTVLNKKVKDSQMLLEAKFYENYQETNTPGIYLSEKEKETIDRELKLLKQKEVKELLQDDRNALNDLLNSKGWKVLLKYADGMEFDVEGGTLIERLALQKSKEQAINAVLSIPECIVDFYEKETK